MNYCCKAMASAVMFSLCVNLFPAAPFAFERESGKMQLEYYLSRAERERSAEKWENLAQAGLLAAMTAWENDNIAHKEDVAAWEQERNEAAAFYESEKEKAFAMWSSARYYERESALKKSELAAALREAAAVWAYTADDGTTTRAVHADNAADARRQWLSEAERITASHYKKWELENACRGTELMNMVAGRELPDDEKRMVIAAYSDIYAEYVKQEYAYVVASETNLLMNELLYDQHSLRKMSDKEAAAVIARTLARDAEKETDEGIDRLMRVLVTELAMEHAEGIELDESEWIVQFEKMLGQSLEKWDTAERNFLAARVQWEQDAEQVYLNDEAVWADAYKELTARRIAWNEKIYAKIEEMQKEFSVRKGELAQEIENELEHYKAAVMAQQTESEKEAGVQRDIYHLYREMMKLCADGIDAWYEHWSEKYRGLYSYWKTEDAAVCNRYFPNGEAVPRIYLKNNKDVQAVKKQLANWNAAYKEMLMREINKTVSQCDNSIQEKEMQCIIYKSQIVSKQKSMNEEGAYHSEQIKSEIAQLEIKIALLEKEIAAVDERKQTLIGYRQRIFNADYAALVSLFKDDGLLAVVRNMVNPARSKAGEEYNGLWNTSDMIYGSDALLIDWMEQLYGRDRVDAQGTSVHENGYRDNALNALTKLYSLTGSTITQSLSDNDAYTDELENELLKAQALKSYWDDELDVAKAVLEYVTTRTSFAQWEAETADALAKSVAVYEAQKLLYDEAVEAISERASDVGAAAHDLNDAFEQVQYALYALNNARQTYDEAYAAYSNMSGEVIEQEIAIAIDEINARVDSATKKTQLAEYYKAMQAYAVATLKKRQRTILAVLQKNQMEGNACTLEKYENLHMEDVLSAEFDWDSFRADIASACPNEVGALEEARSVLHDETAADEIKIDAREKMAAALGKIRLRSLRMKAEQQFAIAYITGTLEGSFACASQIQSLAVHAEAYKKVVFQKLQQLEALGKTESAQYAALEEAFAAIPDFISGPEDAALAYVAEHEDELCAVLEGAVLSDGMRALVAYEYENMLWERGFIKAELVQNAMTQYASYSAAALDEKNRTARAAVAHLISGRIARETQVAENGAQVDADGEACISYILQLQNAGSGLNETGQAALNLYIDEVLRSEAHKENRRYSDVAMAEFAQAYSVAKGETELYELWMQELADEEALAKIIASDEFDLFLSRTDEAATREEFSALAQSDLQKALTLIEAAAQKAYDAAFEASVRYIYAQHVMRIAAERADFERYSEWQDAYNSENESTQMQLKIAFLLSDEQNFIDECSAYFIMEDELYEYGMYDSGDVSDDEHERLFEKVIAAAHALQAQGNARQNALVSLESCFEMLKACYEGSDELRAALEQTANDVTHSEKTYAHMLHEQQKKLDAYMAACNAYNEQLKKADDVYAALNDARLARRVQEEISAWAENEYLHTGADAREYGYESPEEKYARVQKSAAAATLSYETIQSLKETYEKDGSLYRVEFTNYSNAYEKYYLAVLLQYEMDAAIKAQKETLDMAEARAEAAREELIKTMEIDSTCSYYDDAARHFVRVTKEGEAYAFKLETDGAETDAEQAAKDDYFSEWTVPLYRQGDESAFLMRRAQYDAFEWYTQLEKKQEQLEKIVLAAMYLETCGTAEEQAAWFKNGGATYLNPLNTSRTSNELSIIPQKMHAVHLQDLYNEYRQSELQAVYDEVICWDDGKENIAKYFLYRGTYLSHVNGNLEERAEILLTERACEKVAHEIVGYEAVNYAVSAEFAIMAAAFFAVAFPFNWVALGAAIAASIVSLSFTGIAVSWSVKKRDIRNEAKAEKSNRQSKESIIRELIAQYEQAEQNRIAEREKLDIMKYGAVQYGDDIAPLTYEAFRASLAENLGQSNLYDGARNEKVLTVEKLETLLYAVETNQTSMEELFNAIQEEHAYAATSDVVCAIVQELARVQNEQYAALTEKADKLRQEQQKAAAAYNARAAEFINGSYDGSEAHMREELRVLAEAAWGNRAWNEQAYRGALIAVYNTYVGEQYTSYRNDEEAHIAHAIDNLLAAYHDKLADESSLLCDAKEAALAVLMNDLQNQIESANAQMRQILARADEEWEKAERKINDSYNTWRKKFSSEYAAKNDAWERAYADFLADKQTWLVEQYMYAQNVGNYGLLLESGLDADEHIRRSLETMQTAIEADAVIIEMRSNVSEWVGALYDSSLFEKLNQSTVNIAKKAQDVEATVRKGTRMLSRDAENMASALAVQTEISNELRALAARLTAERAAATISDMLEAFAARLENENRQMETWELSMVADAGYLTDGTIRRKATVDAYLIIPKREEQTVHRYEWFRTDLPDIQTTFLRGTSEAESMQKIYNAQMQLEAWSTRIFGKADGGGIKQHVVARNLAEAGKTEQYAASESGDSNVRRYKELKEKLDKKIKLTENEMQEYAQLMKAVAEIRDGAFGEHLGYAPVFKDELAYYKSVAENVAAAGKGEIGKIMLDFTWNELKRGHGTEELAKAPYERKLWPEGGPIEPPSLRKVTDVVLNIVGNVTGQKWIGLLDDALFGVMDMAIQYKSPLEVAVDMGKTGASFALGYGMNKAGDAVSGAIDKMKGAVLKGATHAAWSAGSSYVTTAANSYINALHVDANGHLAMDWKNANRSWWSKDALVAAASSSAGGLMSGTLRGVNTFDGGSVQLDGKTFNTKDMAVFNNFMGALASSGTTLAMTGSATFNVASVMGTGFLEVTVGKAGVSSRIGTGGANVSIGTLAKAAQGFTESNKVVSWKYGGEERRTMLGGVNMLSHSYDGTNNLAMNYELAKDIWEGRKRVEYGKFENGKLGTHGGDTIYISDKLLGGGKEGSGQLASLLSHEGAHMQGLDEFNARLVGYDTYNVLSDKFRLTGSGCDGISDVAYMSRVLKDYGTEALFTELFFSDAFAKENQENYFANLNPPGWKQWDNLENENVPLARGFAEFTIKSNNECDLEAAYNNHLRDDYYKNYKGDMTYEEFVASDKKKYADSDDYLVAIEKKGVKSTYSPITYDSLYSAGCTLATAAYFAYTLSGNLYSFQDANSILVQADKNAEDANDVAKRIFSSDSSNGYQINLIAPGRQYANAINTLAGFDAVTYQNAVRDSDGKILVNQSSYYGSQNIAHALESYNSNPYQEYIAHMRISSFNGKNENAHSVVYQGSNYSLFDFGSGAYKYMSSVNVYDPIRGNRIVDLNDVYRADIYKVLQRKSWSNFGYVHAENTGYERSW